ncbi:MAG: hypothetical protein FWE77_02645 [Clostridia bacterium]|nr:hypothetical protein [Clostridia bacterium]
MNRQQKSMLIAVAGMLALVLVVILIIGLNQRGPDQPEAQPEPLAATETPAAPDGTKPPLTEEEMGRQAMLEEEGEDELGGPEEELPVD